MNQHKIKIYYPIYLPNKFEKKDYNDYVNHTIKEIIQLANIDFPFFEYNNQINIQIINSDSDNDFWKIHNKRKKYIRDEIVILFDTTIEFENKQYEGLSQLDSNCDHIQDSVEYFEKRIIDFLLIVNLARVGSLEINKGYIFVDNEFYKLSESLLNSIRLSVDLSNKIGWPKFDNLKIKDTWFWYLEKLKPVDCLSSTKIERAFNAYSNLYGISHGFEFEQLFWILLGLESIYVKGNSGITEQVRKKSQVFLGKDASLKKRLNQMYDFRSRFIHGEKNFPNKFTKSVDLEEFDKFSNEIYDTINFSQAILIASLQKLIRLGWTNIDFDYKIVGNEE